MTTFKVCSKCRQEKPEGDFYTSKIHASGLRPQCKACMKAAQDARGEAYRSYQRAYREAHLEEHRAADRARIATPEGKAKNIARARAWYRANTERARSSRRTWDKENKPARRGYSYGRRARERGNGPAEKVVLADIYLRDSGLCHLCGRHVVEAEASLDHVIPISRGGPHTNANVKIAHLSCNRRRWAKPLPLEGLMFPNG